MTVRIALASTRRANASLDTCLEWPGDLVQPVVRSRRPRTRPLRRSAARVCPWREGTDPASRGLAGATNAYSEQSREGRLA